jgi:hypothetical protein
MNKQPNYGVQDSLFRQVAEKALAWRSCYVRTHKVQPVRICASMKCGFVCRFPCSKRCMYSASMALASPMCSALSTLVKFGAWSSYCCGSSLRTHATKADLTIRATHKNFWSNLKLNNPSFS